MKRIWIQRIGAAVLCAVLLAGCMAYLHMALREAGSELKINPCGETEYKLR